MAKGMFGQEIPEGITNAERIIRDLLGLSAPKMEADPVRKETTESLKETAARIFADSSGGPSYVRTGDAAPDPRCGLKVGDEVVHKAKMLADAHASWKGVISGFKENGTLARVTYTDENGNTTSLHHYSSSLNKVPPKAREYEIHLEFSTKARTLPGDTPRSIAKRVHDSKLVFLRMDPSFDTDKPAWIIIRDEEGHKVFQQKITTKETLY